MIITVTPNPSIDKISELDQLQIGGLNRLQNILLCGAGKGINVSKMVHILGGNTLATGFLGKGNSHVITTALDTMCVPYHFVPVEGNVRINLKVLTADGSMTELNEPGNSISVDSWDILRNKIMNLATPDSIVVFSGRLPPGTDPTVYRDLINALHMMGTSVFLDADGDTFARSIEAFPDFIKPNRFELLQYFGETDNNGSTEYLLELCCRLLDTGVQLVALSLGKDGAIFASKKCSYLIPGLPVKAHSTAGAGDCMVAALVYGMQKGLSFEEYIALSVACSAGAVTTKGTQPPDIGLVQTLLSQVRLVKLA